MKRCELKPRFDQEASFPFFIIHFKPPIDGLNPLSPPTDFGPTLAVWFANRKDRNTQVMIVIFLSILGIRFPFACTFLYYYLYRLFVRVLFYSYVTSVFNKIIILFGKEKCARARGIVQRPFEIVFLF